jgi:hypothetical protein
MKALRQVNRKGEAKHDSERGKWPDAEAAVPDRRASCPGIGALRRGVKTPSTHFEFEECAWRW